MENHALLTDLTPEQEEKVSGGIVLTTAVIIVAAKKFGVGVAIKKYGATALKVLSAAGSLASLHSWGQKNLRWR